MTKNRKIEQIQKIVKEINDAQYELYYGHKRPSTPEPSEWKRKLDKEWVENTKVHDGYLCLDSSKYGTWLKPFIQTLLAQREKEILEKRYRVEGMSALLKFIRNKARMDIMKADEYGQGYYQAIKDMENYFGISEIDTLSEAGEKGEEVGKNAGYNS